MSDKLSDDDNDVFVPEPGGGVGIPDTSDPKLEPLNMAEEIDEAFVPDVVTEKMQLRTAVTLERTTPSPRRPEVPIPHKLTRVAVLFHEDGEVCPLSRGEKCTHADDDGRPIAFANAEDQEAFDTLRGDDDDAGDGKLRNLRKLAGCFDAAQKLSRIMSVLPNGFNGVRIPNQGLSWDDGTAMAGTVEDLLPVNQGPLAPTAFQQQQNLIPPGFHPMQHLQHLQQQQQQYLNVPFATADPFFSPGFPAAAQAVPGYAQAYLASARADSGVGESIEGTITTASGGYMHPFFDSPLDELEGLGEEGEDELQALPEVAELRKYERKKKMGLNFLSSMNVQQLAAMNPSLKSSMDQFLSQLEATGFSVRK